jgi:hypothetical protein
MERLRRRFFRIKKSSKSKDFDANDDDEEIYLEPQYDETTTIARQIDAIAEEIITIAKKSVRLVLYNR